MLSDKYRVNSSQRIKCYCNYDTKFYATFTNIY